jgi:hypothetical protein
VNLLTRQLDIRASIVDQIAFVTHTPQTHILELDSLLGAIHQIPEIVEFVRVLLDAQSTYDADQASHETWRRPSLFESILELSHATQVETNLSARLDSKDFDRFLAEARNLGAFPDLRAYINLYEDKKPFSSQLKIILQTDCQPPGSFFVTTHGLCGLCMAGARVGDQVAIHFRDVPGWEEVPFIIRQNHNDTHAMVSVA